MEPWHRTLLPFEWIDALWHCNSDTAWHSDSGTLQQSKACRNATVSRGGAVAKRQCNNDAVRQCNRVTMSRCDKATMQQWHGVA